MFSVAVELSIDDPWRAMPPIRVGRVPTGEPSPCAFATVELRGEPVARIDIHGVAVVPFWECLAWRRFVVIGRGDAVYVVDPIGGDVRTIPCDGYFGHLYPADRDLLVASATELICLDVRGDQKWRCPYLGIDGVVVDRVAGGVIEGRGESDPPGGWRTFRVSLKTGRPIGADRA